MRKDLQEGRPFRRPFNPIKFDVSRVLRRNADTRVEEAERIVAEQLVMGHPKLRETGVFWWSLAWWNEGPKGSSPGNSANEGKNVRNTHDPTQGLYVSRGRWVEH